MKKPHKHAELIKAWADGAEIECWVESTMEWMHIANPNWYEKHQYRIKPEPKPDMRKHIFVSAIAEGICEWKIVELRDANLRLTFDGETGKLKKAEVLE